MKIVCATSVLRAEEAFSTLGDVIALPEERIDRESLREADVLVTRSKTRINRELLEDTGVRFVGCAVSGVDHIDTDYLNERKGIAWCAAAGCNANSVAEYIVSAVLSLTQRHGLILSEKTLGVIGVGNIGERVVEKARALGLRVLMNDPPRQAASDDARFLPLDEVLAQSDIVTLHVPLTDGGSYATRHLADYVFFERIKPGALFINTARGEVTDPDALMLSLEQGAIRQAALDVWENEPAIEKRHVDAVEIGTPHIAGYSYEGRLNGTRIVYRELCHYLEVKPTWTPASASPGPGDVLEIDARGRLDDEVLWEAVRHVYDIEADSRRFKEGASDDPEDMARHFIRSRREYPDRPGFADRSVRLIKAEPALAEKLRGLGFSVTGV